MACRRRVGGMWTLFPCLALVVRLGLLVTVRSAAAAAAAAVLVKVTSVRCGGEGLGLEVGPTWALLRPRESTRGGGFLFLFPILLFLNRPWFPTSAA